MDPRARKWLKRFPFLFLKESNTGKSLSIFPFKAAGICPMSVTSSLLPLPREAVPNEHDNSSVTTASKAVEKAEPPFVLCPLVNLGNTCYFNAGIQLLVNCTHFVYSLRNSPFRHSNVRQRLLRSNQAGGKATHELFQACAQLMYDMEYSGQRPDRALSPVRALDCLAAVYPTFEGRSQQDCLEMVNVMIANLSEVGRQQAELEELITSFERDAAAIEAPTGVVVESGGPPSTVSREVDISHSALNNTCSSADRLNHGGVGDAHQLREVVDSSMSSVFTSCLALSPHHQLTFPGSWWNFNVMKVMQKVNKENELLLRKESERKEKPSTEPFRPPKIFHFEPVLLKGSNKYRCATCNTMSEATKRETILSLPEYLLLHMKRFEHGRCFSIKKTDPIIFPLSWSSCKDLSVDALQLKRYMHTSTMIPYTDLPVHRTVGCGSLPMNAATRVTSTLPRGSFFSSDYKIRGAGAGRSDAEANVAAEAGLEFPITTFTLEAVVNHHGSIGGGHYTAFARKKMEEDDIWVHMNDEEMQATNLRNVAESEEYMLLYKKQSIYPRSETFNKLRDKARRLLASGLGDCSGSTSSRADTHRLDAKQPRAHENTPRCSGCEQVYISRFWLQRMAFMEEPGPIYNCISYATEGDEDQSSSTPRGSRTRCYSAGCFYIPLYRCEYSAFYGVYGGNVAVTQQMYDSLLHEQRKSP
uniref:Putative ubiquitin carboxyl-terminal hydrolase n=1 Tax=Trypanosoma vivax (strain Y486) TaxID=1055687 RepID=G0UDC5_TRYVY|nr:putative ubiquitin carboxyl-terminal hydrolase, fragment [Trypanosoma vivax Y486]